VSLILKPASEAAPFQTGGDLALDAIRVLRDVCFGITSEASRATAPVSLRPINIRQFPPRPCSATEIDRNGKRAFNIRAASLSFALLFPILLISRLA